MHARKQMVTGPLGAALHGLDGYREIEWRPRWCVPIRSIGGEDVIRTRRWAEPVMIDDVPVAPLELVLRHLDTTPDGLSDRISPLQRVEYAVEHAYRAGRITRSGLAMRGAQSPGERLLLAVLRQRGGEPATGSFAETTMAQVLRRHRFAAWRQVAIVGPNGRKYVADFLVPFRPGLRRPTFVARHHGVIVEVDGRGPHAPQLERDYARNKAYDDLDLNWLAITPTQVGDEKAVAELLHRHLGRGVLSPTRTVHNGLPPGTSAVPDP